MQLQSTWKSFDGIIPSTIRVHIKKRKKTATTGIHNHTNANKIICIFIHTYLHMHTKIAPQITEYKHKCIRTYVYIYL